MAYGTVALDTLQSSTTGTPTVFKDGAGNTIGTLCRAWVNFTGSTAVINSSFNVSSITRASAGVYTVNFTNAFTDANYAAFASAGSGSGGKFAFPYSSSAPTASAFSLQTTSFAGSNEDETYVAVGVFK